MTESEIVRNLARIKNMGGENPTGADILRLAAKIQSDVVEAAAGYDLNEIPQIVDDIMSRSVNDAGLLFTWDTLEGIINDIYAATFLKSTPDSMTMDQVALNLVQISKSINENSTHKEIMDAGSRVIGQTVANLGIDINEHVEEYPVLDDIIAGAYLTGSGDGMGEEYFVDGWREMVVNINNFYEEVSRKA